MIASKSQITAFGLTMIAFAGYLWLRRKASSESATPSLVINTNSNMKNYPEYDMRQYGNSLARGYRNNNPLNIDHTATKWQGKVEPSQDSRFETFASLPWGYRAAMVTMRTYITKYGLNTIYKIINRWAPADDGNNPLSYTNRVCQIINEHLGGNVTPDTIVTRNDKQLLTQMAYAMSLVENGDKDFARSLGLPSMEIINKGWELI